MFLGVFLSWLAAVTNNPNVSVAYRNAALFVAHITVLKAWGMSLGMSSPSSGSGMKVPSVFIMPPSPTGGLHFYQGKS